MTRAAAMIGLALVLSCGGAEFDATTDLGSSEAALSGVNGRVCVQSGYDCKLRPSGGNRVRATPRSDAWQVVPGDDVLDGDGDSVGVERGTTLSFNYGQTRTFGGRLHAFATSTSNGSAGWYPVDRIVRRDAFTSRVGHVSARGAGLSKLGCYEVRDAASNALAALKVVYDAKDSHERAGDYLPLVRADGRPSANLCFNVPGFSLGGVAVDHFPAGTRFQRLDVPTSTGRPSIDVPLWKRDATGRYRLRAGTLKFVYGYVIAKTGTKRVGWMAYPALKVSSDCP